MVFIAPRGWRPQRYARRRRFFGFRVRRPYARRRVYRRRAYHRRRFHRGKVRGSSLGRGRYQMRRKLRGALRWNDSVVQGPVDMAGMSAGGSSWASHNQPVMDVGNQVNRQQTYFAFSQTTSNSVQLSGVKFKCVWRVPQGQAYELAYEHVSPWWAQTTSGPTVTMNYGAIRANLYRLRFIVLLDQRSASMDISVSASGLNPKPPLLQELFSNLPDLQASWQAEDMFRAYYNLDVVDGKMLRVVKDKVYSMSRWMQKVESFTVSENPWEVWQQRGAGVKLFKIYIPLKRKWFVRPSNQPGHSGTGLSGGRVLVYVMASINMNASDLWKTYLQINTRTYYRDGVGTTFSG